MRDTLQALGQILIGLGCAGTGLWVLWIYIAKIHVGNKQMVCATCGLSYRGGDRGCPYCPTTACWNCGLVWDHTHGCPGCGAPMEEPDLAE
jgi:hypothetical protein